MKRRIIAGLALAVAALITPTVALRFIVAVLVVATGGIVASVTSPPVAAHECGPGYYWSSSHQTCVESPDDSPSGLTAICQDGSDSHALSARGTCSHHGGVAEWCPCAGVASSATNGIPVRAADVDTDDFVALAVSLVQESAGFRYQDLQHTVALTCAGRRDNVESMSSLV
jgi:hypothetical protein